MIMTDKTKQESIDNVYKCIGYILGLLKDSNWPNDGSSIHLCAILSRNLNQHFEDLYKYFPNDKIEEA